MEIYKSSIGFLKGMPSSLKIFAVIGIIVFLLYSFYKRKKLQGVSPFEREIGKEFRNGLKSLKTAAKAVKSSELQGRLQNIVSVSRRIYKKVIGLDMKEITQKLGDERIYSIIHFAREQLPLTKQLLDNYISLEQNISYSPAGEKVYSDSEKDMWNAAYMNAIERELIILERAFINLYNDIETAVNGQYARTIKTETSGNSDKTPINTSGNTEADMNNIRNLIIQLNRNIEQDKLI